MPHTDEPPYPLSPQRLRRQLAEPRCTCGDEWHSGPHDGCDEFDPGPPPCPVHDTEDPPDRPRPRRHGGPSAAQLRRSF